MTRTCHVPGLRLRSLNELLREIPKTRSRRVKREKEHIATMLLAGFGVNRPALPAVVTIVRHGPKPLDGDNAQGGAKHLRDSVAGYLGTDDASPLIEWRYEQRQGEYGVTITIESVAKKAVGGE